MTMSTWTQHVGAMHVRKNVTADLDRWMALILILEFWDRRVLRLGPPIGMGVRGTVDGKNVNKKEFLKHRLRIGAFGDNVLA